MSDAAVHLYQIAYSAQTLASLEPGFQLLDNTSNERPDWFEYWPIRRFLLEQPLDDTAFYGFFSPKFGFKTGLGHAAAKVIVQSQAAQVDVVLFSPQPDMGAFFLNVFEQAETFDPGLIDAFEAFLTHIGRPTGLRSMVMDVRQTVFSNYFVARPAFWRAWLTLGEQLFFVCEGPDSAIQRGLTVGTTYGDAAQRKVFLQERLASYLLCTDPGWRCHASNPFGFAWSSTRFKDYPVEAVISDALKTAYRERAYPEYLAAFGRVREIFSGKPVL